MKPEPKKTKSKNLTIRMYDRAYTFIEDKAKEKGITKADFIISQLDPNSELVKFIQEDSKRLEKELEQIKEQHKKEMEELDNEFVLSLEKMDEKTFLEMYDENDSPAIKRLFKIAAKKKGIKIK